ncbi:tRNA lysidine(34) synthetase TilS [Cnuibacter physcomitrellae]|uniref:tRNA lysidine(34) synthetase TilS n=1 Tax=Cnuibacter physcomitrellae TaxID=1619308 RepID=UPI0021759C57|nr:tRNA lysidine(34) synthetase TilS [Cnuibacter physcomitrellae]MCS5498986.1 tRNA lysidine(34) synthetase TilS [Cnuibacter physcomitrellae]
MTSTPQEAPGADDSGRRPRLTPSIADVRRAVRESFERMRAAGFETDSAASADVLVALSGGPDSLALAAAVAFEAPRAGIAAGAIVVDHGLQPGSAAVAERAARQAVELGLAPVLVRRVEVAAGSGSETGGPEAAARAARYDAIDAALAETGARAVLLGHTLDDQAETVLLGLARGAGAGSLSGMAPQSGSRIRPLLGIRRATTTAFCADSGLEPWRDPHNDEARFSRVRVRNEVLPVLERELGPGVAEALARTATQLREDDDALHDMAVETIEDLVEHVEAGIGISAGALEANPPALRHRVIRYVVESEFGVSLSRAQTLAAASLVTDWHGQKGVDLPGIRVVRRGRLLVFERAA